MQKVWGSFSTAIFSDTTVVPGSVQYIETRRAFYAGAISVLSSIMNATIGTTDAEDEAVADAIQAELDEWAQRLARREV